MTTKEEIDKARDEAENEIKAVLDKYGMELGMLYDDGVAITLHHTQADGTVRWRETAL